MAQLIPLGEPVTRGEKKLLEYLQHKLPADWIVFGNPLITTGELSRELDAVVLGDRCIWVVDEKGFGGRITGDEHVWILSDGSARERALNNVLHAAKMVKGRLVATESQLRGVWVEGVVILSAEDADLQIQDPRRGRHVISLRGCEEYFIQNTIQEGRKLSSEERKLIEKCLGGEKVFDRIRKRFNKIGNYKLLERISTGSVARSYRAERERTPEIVELKLYDLSALPDNKTREQVRKQAEREFKTLRTLRDVQRIVRIAESFQPVEGHGGELYYLALDLPIGPCLASKIPDASWSFESRFAAAKRLCEIMREVHEAGVIHRNLNPSCMHFWRSESDFQLTGFEFSRIPTSSTHISTEELPAGPYTAPEVIQSVHNASKSSDIYSLGIILFEMLSGQTPFGNRAREPEDPNPILSLNEEELPAEKRDHLEALLLFMVDYKASDRLEDLSQVIDLLGEIELESTWTGEVAAPKSHPLPEGYQLGEFTILGYLGMGGCFHAYRVASSIDDTQEYVAKVVRYPELLELAQREFAVLSRLDHPNIIRVYDVSFRVDAPYHLLEVYASGQPARDVVAKGPSQADNVARWALALADALVHMETREPKIYHGDISARNIVLSDDNPYLIDFGLAYLGEEFDEEKVVGTAPYRPPERDMPGTKWPLSGDVYSLGVVLCELLFGGLPYRSDGGQFDKYHLREDLFEPRGQASSEFLQVLRRAVEPDYEARFENGREFRDSLAEVPELAETKQVFGQERAINQYLDEVLKVYNRGACNAENRGMDSEFARATYVPTELDSELLPEILSGKYALVVLAGNPGDGKTAFLQQIALSLGFEGDDLPLHHWLLKQNGWTFECVLDGSAADSERGLNSDEVLNSLIAPLEKQGESVDLAESLRRTQLLAINDGRLLEYLYEKSESPEEESWVVRDLLTLIGEKSGTSHPQLVLVDLNRRSLAANPDEQNDVFDKILDALLLGGWEDNRLFADPWQECVECRAAPSCHVRFNVNTLLDPALGPQVRKKLKTLLMLVHSRGRLHITIRELRSMLAFLLFGDQSCEEIHKELESGTGESGEIPANQDSFEKLKRLQLNRLYFNRFFATRENGGRLYDELSEFDPERVDNPRLDRLISSALNSPENIESFFVTTERRPPHSTFMLGRIHHPNSQTTISHSEIRRRVFFEGRPEIFAPARPNHHWLHMTPFHSVVTWIESLSRFREGQYEFLEEVCQRICGAVSLTDNVPEDLLDRYLAIRTATSLKTDLVVVRLFDLSDFRLFWERSETQGTVFGELPTAMLLQFGESGDPTLEISADLFELLSRFADGYRLGSEELEGVAAHLQLFKNRLLAMPATEVCLWHPKIGRFMAKQKLTEKCRQIMLEELE
jgi:serine/threonine protein kinase